MQSTVSIIGAGWIGLPLAHNLKTQGKQVRVTTTSPDKAQRLTESGLQAFEVSLSPEPQGAGWEQFLDSEVIVVSIPPKVAQKGADFHPDQMRALLRLVPAHAKVLYTGSSGIFADHGGETVDEDTAPRLVQPRAQALGHAEEVLRQQLGTRLTIVRFGGLMGMTVFLVRWRVPNP
ncbi:MAG: NAD(P)-binding domain-containing protein [Bacteroidota bacterium]